MNVPWWPILSAAAAALGLGGLYWYDRMSAEEKAEADEFAGELANDLFNKSVEELTRSERSVILARVQRRFAA